MDTPPDWRVRFRELEEARLPPQPDILDASPAIADPPEPKPKLATAKPAAAKRKTARKKPAAKRATTRKPASRKPRAAKPKITKPRATAKALPAALPLPPLTEPEGLIVAPAPLPETALPRSAAPVPYRKSGLLGLMGFWLRSAVRRNAAPPPRQETGSNEAALRDELTALRAENARLRQELESLLALYELEKPSLPA